MSETLNLSTSHMTEADLKAIATYLKDPPGGNGDQNQSVSGAPGPGGNGGNEGRREDLCR
jgi:hypothetical protein